jgi:hypothetical protein
MVRAMNSFEHVVELQDVSRIRQGHPFRGAIPHTQDGPVQVIQLKNLASPEALAADRLLRTRLQYRNEPDWLRSGDVLLAGRGNRPHTVLLPEPGTFTLCSPHIYVIRVTDEGRVLPGFLAWQLRQPSLQEQMRRRSAGTRQLSLCKSDVAQLKIQLPPLPLQRRILSIHEAAAAERATLEAIRQTRQQELTALTERLLQGSAA